MAIYFLNLKTLGRAAGSSSVSAAAYRAGERIKDERTGRTYDHSSRQGVLHKEIMLPNKFSDENMSWAKDRSSLWNGAERAEVRGDARTAREYLVALPAELSPQGRINLVKGFSRELVERYGFALDVAIHAPRDYPGSDPRNFHAHLLATTREVTREGLGAKTTLEWSDTSRRRAGLGRAVGELRHVRERWAVAANSALEREHLPARIDHRTLRAQGIDREPKPHIPHAAFEMERHGHRSVVAERIRANYQARVEARLQREAQQSRISAPNSLLRKAKEYALTWFGYRQERTEVLSKNPELSAQEPVQKRLRDQQAQETQPKSRDDITRESAHMRARHRQAQPKNQQDLAKESARRWKAQYGPAQSKSPRDVANESAQKWLRYREEHKEKFSKSPEQLAQEAALRWHRYREEHKEKFSKSPEQLSKEAALRWHRYREEHKEKFSKSPEQLAQEAALRWHRYREEHKEKFSKSPEQLSKEAALRWHNYRQEQMEARAPGKQREQGKEPTQGKERKQGKEREQIELARASPKRSRELDGPSI